jgi:hypothetical protein
LVERKNLRVTYINGWLAGFLTRGDVVCLSFWVGCVLSEAAGGRVGRVNKNIIIICLFINERNQEIPRLFGIVLFAVCFLW